MNRFRRSLALLLVFAMVFMTFSVVTVSAQTFSDVSGHWAEALIDKWSASGVINGYEDGTFRPDDNITRAELAKVISVSKGYTEEAAIAFSDVSEDDWFTPSLKKCVAKGVIGGYEDGTFRPDAYVNREEAATMIVRAYNINATALLSFTDSADISPWAQNAVTALVGANVINGYEDGSFGPKNSITRAELVKMLDGAASAEILFPQATDSTGGTNSVGTIGNLGGFHGSGSTTSGGGGGSTTSRSYNVTFDANGGSFENGRINQSVSVSQNMVIGSRVSDPVREGMKFDGWYTSRDAAEELIASKKWDLNTDKVTKSMTLYAGWYVEGDVVVTFESCGGSAVAAQTVQSGNLASEPAAPTRANYTFTGWYTDNKATKKFDFAKAAIRKNTTLYAGWSLNADYAGVEITLPDETDPESNLKTGSVVAVPPTAIAGETVKLKVTAPEGFTLEGIKSITYLASVTEGETTTEQTVTLDPAAIAYDAATDTYSFVMPADAIGNVKIAPKFEMTMPTPKPTPTPGPTPTPAKMPTYYFTMDAFSELTEIAANTETGGLTVSKASTIDGSKKTFTPSGFSYTRRLKISTATLSFNVTGSCYINIDAASASSADRIFDIYANGDKIGEFTCVDGAVDTAAFSYGGGKAAKIEIKPRAGINVYGIEIVYDASAPNVTPEPTPTPTPTPTIDPNIRYNINVGNAKNGTVVVSNGINSSDKISKNEWQSVDSVPAGSVLDGNTIIFPEEKPEFYLNGKDASDGKVVSYQHLVGELFTDPDTSKEYTFIHGLDNPNANPPFTDQNQPDGGTFRVDTTKQGYLKLEVYINAGKAFNLYDNMAGAYLEQFTPSTKGVHTFVFSCEEAGSYYLWAKGSKIGMVSATYMSEVLDAKAGETVTVKTNPEEGYKTKEVTVTPATNVTKISENEYSFKMPVGDVSVGATFIGSSAKEYTVTAPAPENGSVELKKDVSAASDDAVINSSENFFVADGGNWIVSSDGTVGTTAVKDTTDIGGNTTEKIKLTDKAVQYALDDASAIKSGSFTLSYDFYDDNTADAGRSFRTYLDNAAHPVEGGQATEMGTDAAIFHMMDVGGKVFVTNTEADIAGKTEAGIPIGASALEASKWYRVVISGNLDDNTVEVAYFLHGTDGKYDPNNISSSPYIVSEAAFTPGRTMSINQVKFMRTAAGNLYYDNIVLTSGTGVTKSLKVYDGETVMVVATPDMGFALDKIEAKQTDGTPVTVTGNKFVMPQSDVEVTVTFVPESSKPSTEPTQEPTKPENPNEWVYDDSYDGCAEGTELIPGFTTLFADKAGNGKKYLTSDANGSFSDGVATGTAFKYVASANGTLTVGFTGLGTPGSNGNPKTVYIVEEGGSQDSPVAMTANTSTTEKLTGVVTGTVEAGKTYYIYGAGTKGCFVSALFTPAG